MTSDVDRQTLEYAACHPLVLVSQVQMLLHVQAPVATERLDALAAAGLVRHSPRLRHQPGSYQITALGLREIGSELSVPRVDLRRYWQDVCVAWLSLHTLRGELGEVERVYCEREMRVADERAEEAGQTVDPRWSPAVRAKAAESSFALRLDSDVLTSPARLHYPDLMLVVPQGRVAVELQLTPVGRRPLERILTAYALKPSIAVVLYLVQDGGISDAVRAAAASLGLTRLVRVKRIMFEFAGH